MAGTTSATRQTSEVVDLVRGVLGDDVVGVYLYGSAVMGGLRWSSDIDVFVVSRRPTTLAERRALGQRLLWMSGKQAAGGPARSIELTVVVQSEVRPWRYPPRLDFQYGDWLRAEFEEGTPPSPRPSPDLAVVITMLLAAGRPLFGPSADEVLDPVPTGDLHRALIDVIPGLLDDLETDTANVTLTLARIWTTLATGDIRTKDAASDWAMERVPEDLRKVLAHARATYLGDEPERWDDLQPLIPMLAEFIVRKAKGEAGIAS
jgi:predicted nucleotidyltransferase